MLAFRLVTSYNFVGVYRRFGGTSYHHRFRNGLGYKAKSRVGDQNKV
jgi:hypothetical protein